MEITENTQDDIENRVRDEDGAQAGPTGEVPGEGTCPAYSDWAGEIFRVFDVNRQDIRTFSPLTLAFLGDNVFDLLIRTILAEKSTAPRGDPP